MNDIYNSIYEKGLANGFHDVDVWTYFNRQSEHAQIECETPFEYNGEPLIGVAVVDIASTKDGELRTYSSCMFQDMWGRNIEDVEDMRSGSRDYKVVDTRTHKSVDYTIALEEMGQFASSVSYQPHVEIEGEYTVHKLAHDLLPNYNFANKTDYTKSYAEYIADCVDRMKAGEHFVGARTSEDALYEDGEIRRGNERISYYTQHKDDIEATVREYAKYITNRSKLRQMSVSFELGIDNASEGCVPVAEQ